MLVSKCPNLDTLPLSLTECGSPTGEQYNNVPAAVTSFNRCLCDIGGTPFPRAANHSTQIERKMETWGEYSDLEPLQASSYMSHRSRPIKMSALLHIHFARQRFLFLELSMSKKTKRITARVSHV